MVFFLFELSDNDSCFGVRITLCFRKDFSTNHCFCFKQNFPVITIQLLSLEFSLKLLCYLACGILLYVVVLPTSKSFIEVHLLLLFLLFKTDIQYSVLNGNLYAACLSCYFILMIMFTGYILSRKGRFCFCGSSYISRKDSCCRICICLGIKSMIF